MLIAPTMLDIKVSGFDKIINQVELYYNKVLVVTDDVALQAKDLILSRIESGKNSSGKILVTKSKEKDEDGYYSASWGEVRRSNKKPTSPMTLKDTGGLYKAFTFRKKYKVGKDQTYILQLYVKNNQVKGRNITYAVLAAYHEDMFGASFKPTKGEFNKISKMWKKRL